jgi:hypothetical protein
MSGVQFELQLDRSTAALNRWKHAPDGVLALHSHDWAHGSMGALLSAELLAAEAGLVPWIDLPNGDKGIATIGEARSIIDNAPPGVRTLYKATHGVVRMTHATAKAAGANVPSLGEILDPHPVNDAIALAGLEGEPELGAIPVALIVGCVAIAAIIAGAWYLRQETKLEVEGKNTRHAAELAQLSATARESLRVTGKIDENLYKLYEPFAALDKATSGLSWPLIAGGVGISAIGGAYLYRRFAGRR